jgi:16S rRNA (adenine1518-N6/adenine1519-N6)-dimethyltransferase
MNENVHHDDRTVSMQVKSLSDNEIQSLLRKYGVRPNKKLGQSFLKSRAVAQDIVAAADVTRKDTVLEVGGGLGILTEEIADRAGHVHVIELEAGLARALRDLLREHGNVTIIEGDALAIALPEATKVVSNLPYSISSEITFRLLREHAFDQAVLMYQKEFAQRLRADPGTQDYSRLTVNIRYQAEVDFLMEVPATMFFPMPEVDSVVVRMKHRTQGPRAKRDDVFHWMVTGLYSYPNKNLRKALGIWFRNIGVEKSLAEEIVHSCLGHPKGDDRLRNISIEDLVVLADSILGSIDEGRIPDPRGLRSERAS